VKKFFNQLRPLERRLAVGMLVVFVLVMNYVFIWPHFSDWERLKNRRNVARAEVARDQAAVAEMPKYQALVKQLEGEGEFVAPEDQAVDMLRAIQNQAANSHVGLTGMGRQTTSTNDLFFVQQIQNISVTGSDEQIVDFLYKLGSSASMIRVLDLELQPDPTRYNLVAGIRLVASYQKKPAAPASASKKSTAKAK
jgi:Tfp pilus assembly protein PilO